MDEADYTRVLKQGLPVDDAFADDLLKRCLAEFDRAEVHVLDDSELDMLAAAGDLFAHLKDTTEK